jgi:hypothetical protein
MNFGKQSAIITSTAGGFAINPKVEPYPYVRKNKSVNITEMMFERFLVH